MIKNGIFFLVFVLIIMTQSCKNTQYTDIAENKIAEVEHVSSVTIEDYRRAFG